VSVFVRQRVCMDMSNCDWLLNGAVGMYRYISTVNSNKEKRNY
jgi:hypothetical protein